MSPDAALLVLLMRALGGGVDVEPLARAIVATDATWDEALWLVAIGQRESGYRLNAVGDQGAARCAYQLHRAPVAVLTDAALCTRLALHALRASVRLCPSMPLAAYAGARCGSDTAARITRDRDRLRQRALARVLGAP